MIIFDYNNINKYVDYNTYDEDGNFNDDGTQYLPQTCILDLGHFPALVVPLFLPANHDINKYQNISKYKYCIYFRLNMMYYLSCPMIHRCFLS